MLSWTGGDRGLLAFFARRSAAKSREVQVEAEEARGKERSDPGQETPGVGGIHPGGKQRPRRCNESTAPLSHRAAVVERDRGHLWDFAQWSADARYASGVAEGSAAKSVAAPHRRRAEPQAARPHTCRSARQPAASRGVPRFLRDIACPPDVIIYMWSKWVGSSTPVRIDIFRACAPMEARGRDVDHQGRNRS